MPWIISQQLRQSLFGEPVSRVLNQGFGDGPWAVDVGTLIVEGLEGSFYLFRSHQSTAFDYVEERVNGEGSCHDEYRD